MEYRQFAKLEGPFVPASGSQADQMILILLHGWGADGRDLIDLAAPIQAELPHLGLFTPHAPYPCSANPMGRQWFELTERFFEKPASVLAEIEDVSQIIDEMIEALMAELSIKRHQIILGGFSQGGMMTLYLASQYASYRGKKVAGYASIAGALIAPDRLLPAGDKAAPIWLAHGQMDQVVPFAAMEKAQKELAGKQYDVSVCVRPMMAHSIDMPTVESLIAFIKQASA